VGINTIGSCDCRCGTCEDCCNGLGPTANPEVDFALSDSSLCDICDTYLSGNYTLTANTSCNWGYDSGDLARTVAPCNDFECDPTDFFECISIKRFSMGLGIHCGSGANYVVTFQLDIQWFCKADYHPEVGDSGCSTSFRVTTYIWQRTIAVADFNCRDEVDFAIPFLSRTCWCTAGTLECGHDEHLCADNPPDAILNLS